MDPSDWPLSRGAQLPPFLLVNFPASISVANLLRFSSIGCKFIRLFKLPRVYVATLFFVCYVSCFFLFLVVAVCLRFENGPSLNLVPADLELCRFR